MLRLPGSNSSQDTRIAVAAADLEVRQLERAHLRFNGLLVIIREQTLADVEQLGLAEVLWMSEAVLGR